MTKTMTEWMLRTVLVPGELGIRRNYSKVKSGETTLMKEKT